MIPKLVKLNEILYVWAGNCYTYVIEATPVQAKEFLDKIIAGEIHKVPLTPAPTNETE